MSYKCIPQFPTMAVCMDAATSGTPVTLDGTDVVVHEIVQLMPATLEPRTREDDGSVRRNPPARG